MNGTSTLLDEIPIPIVHGPGTLASLGDVARQQGGTRALLVTDAGLCAAGHVDRALKSLHDAGISASIFEHVHENPTTLDAEACAAAARQAEADMLIGLGGGSSMDAAKACNFLVSQGGPMHKHRGDNAAAFPMLPYIAVPTTGGTGSECQRFALISDAVTHEKMACGSGAAKACCIILDPELTLTQPLTVTACTGMDALVHAVETAVTLKGTPASLRFSREAFRLLSANFPLVLAEPSNLEARAAMQAGAALAGAAIELSMLGAAHAMANPLTARYGIIHGQAVTLGIDKVVRFNSADPDTAEAYRSLVSHAGLVEPAESAKTAVQCLADFLVSVGIQSGLNTGLEALDIPPDVIPELAEAAAKEWTGGFNPRPVTREVFADLYRQAMPVPLPPAPARKHDGQ